MVHGISDDEIWNFQQLYSSFVHSVSHLVCRVMRERGRHRIGIRRTGPPANTTACARVR